MKLLVTLAFVFGVMVGVVAGGMYYTSEYAKLYHRYNGAVELLRLYKNYFDHQTYENNQLH